jgi:hypothetical protein
MANQIVVSAGAKVRNLQDVIIGTSGVLTSLGFDVANGVPRLDVNGKILVSQLPNSVMEYKGTWNISTNTPTVVNGVGNQGDVYLVEGAAVGGTSFNFGAGGILFFNGDQAIYSGSIWQRASGATGTVTSVAVTESGDSLNITGSPITTSGTINIGFNGTNLQYVNGAGNLTTFPTLITSIGLSMPSAFSVANSPLTANGTIAVTGAGVASQYIRGDGTLADFPSSGGGGSSVSYYLNGGTSQGTIGGTTYYEMSKTAVIGTGVDFTKSGDGFIVAFLTDANDPAQLNIPAGNWNYEIYASMSANGGTPQMYAELYKYDGTTFTLISTSTNEILYDGTALNLYTFAMTVPATTLALTDRLAVKLYATNSGGKTTTIHTQDSHLCQVITTFSTGITALNGLTAQVQYFQVGTSGTDFNISSTTATHTFNIPDASATARGLITTGTQTIAGTKTFSDATKNNGGIFLQNASSSSLAGYMNLGGLTNGVKFTSGGGISNTFTLPSATGYTFTFPNANGTLALTSDISYPVTSVFGRTGAVVATSGDYTTTQVTEGTNLYYTDVRARLALSFVAGSGAYNNTTGVITIPTNNNQITNGAGYTTNVGTVTSVAATGGTGISITGSPITTSGTITITNSAPDQVVALTASTGISVTGTYPNFTITNTSPSSGGTVTSVAALTIGTSGTDLSSTVATSTTTPVITLNVPTASAANRGALSSADWTTFNNKQSALTNPVTGTGTTNYLPKFTGASTIGNSVIQESSSNIGIGGSPSTKLHSFGTIRSSNAGNTIYTSIANDGVYSTATDLYLSASSTKSMYFYTNNAQKMLLNSSGNLGLGVTPSAWGGGRKALQVGSATSLFDDASGSAILSANAYYDGTLYKYLVGAGASYYIQSLGIHYWYNAPSGTAGNAITFTQAMTLFSTGNLAIATTTDSGYKLDVNGTGRINGSLQVGSGSGGSGTATQSVFQDTYGGLRSAISVRNTADYATGRGSGYSIQSGNAAEKAWFQIQANDATQTGYSLVLGNSGGSLTIASTGVATFSGNVQTGSQLSILGTNTGGKRLFFTGGTNKFNFMVAAQQNVDNGLEITPSTAAGGSTFTTPAFVVKSTGNVLIGTTDDGGRVVSYTTTAATQFKAAGTAPAITFSNTVLSPTIGGVLGVCTAASQFFTGTASSDMVLANQFSAGDLIFGTNNLARMRVKASGVINITSIPTSSVGLVAGDIYSNAGILTIV